MTKTRYHKTFFTLLVALIALSMASLFIGSSGLSFTSLFNDHQRAIISYRFFRTALSIIAGSSLAISGVSLQALFHNPLADPHLFGISGGAALGASLVIAFFSDQAFMLPSWGAIIGGLIAFFVIFYFIELIKHGPLGYCLLVGFLINSLAASLITLLKTILPMNKSQNLLFWLVGHITIVNLEELFLIIPLWIIGGTTLWLIKGKLEILSFGLDESRLLGIDTNKIIKITVIANGILIGNTVAFAGMIGFLGLVIPHLLRLSFHTNVNFLLPISALSGALCMVFFDTLSRMSFILLGSEIPTGVLTALFLSPIFFILLVKSSHD